MIDVEGESMPKPGHARRRRRPAVNRAAAPAPHRREDFCQKTRRLPAGAAWPRHAAGARRLSRGG